MGPMLRASALHGLAPLIDSLGGDGAGLLARFRLPTESAPAETGLVPLLSVNRALETAAVELSCPDLGLRLAEHQDTGILGPLALAIETASTAEMALANASRFMFVHSPALSISIEPDPQRQRGVVGLCLRQSTSTRAYSAQGMELSLGVFHRIITTLLGQRYGLRGVHLAHAPLSPLTRYLEFFDADVRFRQADAVLRVPKSQLSSPLPGDNDLIRSIAIAYLADTYTEPGTTVTARVRSTLEPLLGSTPPALDTVARLLLMHPRTLQRHLAAESSSFDSILDEVRRDRALHLISATDLPLYQVAAMVGFANQPALTRSVRRWFGQTPKSVRTHSDGQSR